MSGQAADPNPLATFLRPLLGLPCWGVKQGHGSFLTFEFGERGLDPRRPDGGEWHLWIYCCHWRAVRAGRQLAWSEDSRGLIGQTVTMINGQQLLAVKVDPDRGRSTFHFERGDSLETWPYDDDEEDDDEQWLVMSRGEAFSYRADGFYSCGPSNTPPDRIRWLPLRAEP